MPGNYSETNLIGSATADGDYPSSDHHVAQGDRIISMFGDLGGATVKFIFFTEKPDGSFEEMPDSPDWEFTAKPAPERFSFSESLPFRIRVTGSTGATDFGVNMHELN